MYHELSDEEITDRLRELTAMKNDPNHDHNTLFVKQLELQTSLTNNRPLYTVYWVGGEYNMFVLIPYPLVKKD